MPATDPVEEFQRIIWASLHTANRQSVAEHARSAHTAGGASIAVLEEQIIDYRRAHGIAVF